MDGSKLISQAFNESVKIDKPWFIMAWPFLISAIAGLLSDSAISFIMYFVGIILSLGIITRIITHVLQGHNDLLKPNFDIYDVDLLISGLKSLVMVFIWYLVIFLIFMALLFLINQGIDIVGLILALISFVIMVILFTLSGFVLAHGINTDSLFDGVIELPSIVKTVGMGNIFIFIIANLFILIACGFVSGIIGIIPFIGSIIGSALVSAFFSFYFFLASAYMYREYVFINQSKFNVNQFNMVLGYPRTNPTNTPEVANPLPLNEE